MKFFEHASKRTLLAAAVTTALGTAVIPQQSSAQVLQFSWDGLFTILDSGGSALANSSITGRGVNQFQTPINGTFTFDTNTGAGTGTVSPFQFFNGAPSLPATAKGFGVQSIGSGLVLGNALFDWNGNYNIPVSLVWDGSGLFGAISAGLSVGNTVSGVGAIPASDGTYTNATIGLLNQGPTPMATTTFNTTNVPGCAPSSCLGVNPSGTLPIITDTASNTNKGYYTPGNTIGIGGNPMQDGPFLGFNANFDVSTLTLISDGSGSITAPADVSSNIPETSLPPTSPIDLGAATNVAPPNTAEYCTDGSVATCNTNNGWVPDNGINTIQVPITQTINTVNVDWRAGGGVAFDSQTATVTVDDATPPVIDSTDAPAITTQVISTADSVCFGAISATDAVEPNLTIDWSHDGFNWIPANPDTGNLNDNCSTGFGPNANTVYWRAIDVAGNTSSYQQTVTLILPPGITGKACTVDLAYAGSRLLEGRFTMRDPAGAISGNIDNTVTGNIDTTVLCTDPDPAICNPMPPAASLVTTQAFFGSLWTATPVRLFDQGTWTFETCPFPRTFDAANNDWIAADGSTKCGSQSTPNPISMTVNPGQIGAHMLFDWSVNVAIDVVVVWDVGCNEFQLTTSDPDGDGILGSKMVDGPFKGFNAAFDVSTEAGQPPIADGGYTTTIPTVQNPVSGESPIPLNHTNPTPAVADSTAVRSCVGGCYAFTATDLLDGNDSGGAYKYVQAVLPLTEATPFWSLYRKFDNTTQTWGPFTIDSRNDVKTAPLDVTTNECPQPGDGSYDRPVSGALAGKLRGGDMCVQLTVEDGGPNDADGAANGSVQDPGGVAEVPAAALPSPATSGGGCVVSGGPVSSQQRAEWWLLAGLLGWLGRRRRKSSKN